MRKLLRRSRIRSNVSGFRSKRTQRRNEIVIARSAATKQSRERGRPTFPELLRHSPSRRTGVFRRPMARNDDRASAQMQSALGVPSRNLHIFEIARLTVDADAGRGDPARVFARLV